MPCIKNIEHYVDAFFVVRIVNNCSIALQFILWRSWHFTVLRQIIMAVKHQENERFSIGVCAPHSLNSVSGFSSVLPPLPLHRNRYFLFLYFWPPKKSLYWSLVIESHHIISLEMSPYHSFITSPTMSRNTHRMIVKTYVTPLPSASVCILIFYRWQHMYKGPYG